MTSKQYRSLLIESTVSGIGKMEVYKSPADKIINSVKDGDVVDTAATSYRNCEDAIAVLGRVYDNDGEDRPMIHENDEEHEAQGDSEISVDLPDSMEDAEVQNIADVIDDDKGIPVGNSEHPQPSESIAAEDGGLEESFILENDEDLDDASDLPEDELDDDDENCPECGKNPCDCDSDDDLPEDSDDASDLPEDELDESDEGLPEDEVDADDEGLPEDEVDADDEGLPEDAVTDDDVSDVPEDSDDASDLPEDEVSDDSEDTDDTIHEDVDDSVLDTDEQTGEDAILGDGEGDAVPAEPIPEDGEVYCEEAAEDPAIDPNAQVAEPVAQPPVEGDPNAQVAEDPNAAAGDPNAQVEDPNAAEDAAVAPEGEAPAEDPTQDPNDEKDPVLDIDSQVVATDTTQESVLESLIREMNSSDEGYMSYESDDFESED